MVAGARRLLTNRWPEYGEEWDAWRRLPQHLRSEVGWSAREGRPHPQPWVAALAVGWAWPMLARSFLRVWVAQVLPMIIVPAVTVVIVLTVVHRGTDLWLCFAGSTSGVMLGQTTGIIRRRRMARRILDANSRVEVMPPGLPVNSR